MKRIRAWFPRMYGLGAGGARGRQAGAKEIARRVREAEEDWQLMRMYAEHMGTTRH